METIADRYNLIQKMSGLSKKDFADTLGISKAVGYQISNSMLKPSHIVMQTLSQTYKVNLNWFITGKGSTSYNPDTCEIELIEQEAAAGHGAEVNDHPETRAFQVPRSLIRPHNPERLKAVYVKGDSMIEEKINDGDVVIFNPNIIEGNGLYVVSVGNTLLVKRVDFNQKDGEITLISANPAYEPRRYSGYDLEDIRVAGRVIACYHRV